MVYTKGAKLWLKILPNDRAHSKCQQKILYFIFLWLVIFLDLFIKLIIVKLIINIHSKHKIIIILLR